MKKYLVRLEMEVEAVNEYMAARLFQKNLKEYPNPIVKVKDLVDNYHYKVYLATSVFDYIQHHITETDFGCERGQIYAIHNDSDVCIGHIQSTIDRCTLETYYQVFIETHSLTEFDIGSETLQEFVLELQQKTSDYVELKFLEIINSYES